MVLSHDDRDNENPNQPSESDASSFPDWLTSGEKADVPSEEASAHEATTSPSEASAPAGMPDWLGASASADMPDWLKEASGAEPGTPLTQSSDAVPATPVDMPDWLQEAAAAAESPASEELLVEPPAPPIDMPDWLSEVSATEPAASTIETPDWLNDAMAEKPGEPSAVSAESAALSETPDWLSEVSATEPAASTTETPDWLSDAMAEKPEEPSAVSAESAALPEAPDWLSEVSATEPAASTTETPDWLSDAMAEKPGEPSAVSAEPAALSEAPDWLSEVSATEPAASTTETPDWLSDAIAEKPGEPSTESAAPAETPEWFEAIAPSEPDKIAVAPPESAVPSSAETTDWLSSMTAPELPAEPSAEMSEPVPATPSEASDWFSDLPVGEPATLPSESPREEAIVIPSSPVEKPLDDLLDWAGAGLFSDTPMAVGGGEDLLGLTSEFLPPSPAESAKIEPEAIEEFIAEAEAETESGTLPDWLLTAQPGTGEILPTPTAMPPKAAPDLLDQLNSLRFDAIVGAETQPAPTEPEKVGALKDVVGVIHPEVVFEGGALTASSLTGDIITTDDQRRRVERLERLLETEKKEVVISAKGRTALPVARWLVTLIMAAAIAVPIVMGFKVLPAPITTPGAADANQLLSTLADNATVLMAFEYEPEAAAELQPLATILLKQLSSHPHVTVYAVSTKTTGPAMANAVYNQVFPPESEPQANSADEESGLAPQETEESTPEPQSKLWINLGYIPGGANGVSDLVLGSPLGLSSRLSFDYQGLPTGIAQLGLKERPPALIIVVSARPEDLRPWIEQAGQSMGTPVLAATSAGSAPMAQPYRRSGQVDALLVGVGDTLGYQALSGEEPDTSLIATWNAQAVGGMVAALAIIAGGIFYGLSSWHKPQEQGK